MRPSLIASLACCGLFVACAPRGQYEEQELEPAQTTQVQELETRQLECDPNVLLEMKEQAQSLDILTQELIDRNTELSKEVARLRVFEAQVKSSNIKTDQQLVKQRQDYENRLERTRQTYEDLVKDLRNRLRLQEQQIRELRSQAPEPESKP